MERRPGAGVPYPWSVLPMRRATSISGIFPLRAEGLASGIISLYAGGQYGFSGDGGPATAAWLAGPSSLALDSGNNLYLADTGNRRIRQVSARGQPAISLSSTSLAFKLAALVPRPPPRPS